MNLWLYERCCKVNWFHTKKEDINRHQLSNSLCLIVTNIFTLSQTGWHWVREKKEVEMRQNEFVTKWRRDRLIPEKRHIWDKANWRRRLDWDRANFRQEDRIIMGMSRRLAHSLKLRLIGSALWASCLTISHWNAWSGWDKKSLLKVVANLILSNVPSKNFSKCWYFSVNTWKCVYMANNYHGQ